MPDSDLSPHLTPRHQSGSIFCPACNGGPMDVFYEISDVPTNSCILLSTREDALNYPRGDVRLGFCPTCGFVFNVAFDLSKTEYSGRYEETQAFSGTFNKFHVALAERLIARHNLYGKDILEIGCGKGEFLMLLAEMGANRGVGIDPGVDVARIPPLGAGEVKFIADFYSETYADHPVDFMACKMTLEHIPQPFAFVSTMRHGLGKQTHATTFIQVPEALRILRDCAFEDIYYEHCAYFSPGSLARMFRASGFDVTDISIEYADQYLTLEARPRPPGAAPLPALAIEDDLAELRALVSSFPKRIEDKLARWRKIVREAKAAGERIVLWGSGSKAVSFLTTLGTGADIDFVTDINPHRHNHYMPLTGQLIVPPAELKQIRPDLVICMNAVYKDEIRSDLGRMDLSPRLLAL